MKKVLQGAMNDQEKLEDMGDDDVKKELFRQYTKHNEEVMESEQDGVVRCKIVLVGAESAGKTSFMNRLTKNQFTQAQSPTVGSAYFVQGVAIEDVEYNFDIWDVSGNSRYKSLVPMYMQFAEACVVVYDVTRPETFEQAKEWVENVVQLGEKDLTVVLVGTKADLVDESKTYVTEEEAQEYANTKLITVYPMCSAKNGDGVEDVMLDIAESIHERRGKGLSSSSLQLDEEREDPYEFATRATTLSRARRKDSVYEDFNERFTGCLSCLNACFADTVSKTQEISKRAAEKTREAFQSMSEQVDQTTKNARKSLKIDWKIKKRTAANRQASLIIVNTQTSEDGDSDESIKKEPYKPVVTVAPLKG